MATQRWNIDTSHSSIQFSVRHMVISKVRGAFDRWQGVVDFDRDNPAASKASVSIETASIATRDPKRDEHLRSPDFFDAEKYPAIVFESTGLEKVGGDKYRVLGKLTIHGVTRDVELDAEYLGGGKDPWGNERIGFQARTSLNRKDFGLSWNQTLEAGGVLVGELIEISLDVQAVKAPAEKAA
jgi:polyisoprenoid-binding protein YceI